VQSGIPSLAARARLCVSGKQRHGPTYISEQLINLPMLTVFRPLCVAYFRRIDVSWQQTNTVNRRVYLYMFWAKCLCAYKKARDYGD